MIQDVMPEGIHGGKLLATAGDEMPSGGMPLGQAPGAVLAASGDPGEVPSLVRAAGERARVAYRAFFDVVLQGSHARVVYRDAYVRFMGLGRCRSATVKANDGWQTIAGVVRGGVVERRDETATSLPKIKPHTARNQTVVPSPRRPSSPV
jgi:hypothetical protein